MTPDPSRHPAKPLSEIVAEWREVRYAAFIERNDCADELQPTLSALQALVREMPHRITGNNFHREDLCYRCILAALIGGSE